MSDLVERSAKKTQLGHPFSGPPTLLDSVFQVPIIPTAPLVASTPSQNDKKINNLTDMIRSLALSVRTLQRDIGTSSTIAQPGPKPPKLSSELYMRTGYQGAGPKKTGRKVLISACTIGVQTTILSAIARYLKMTLILTGFTWETRVECV